MAPDPASPPSAGRVVFVYYKVAPKRVEALGRAFAAAGTPPFASRAQLLRRADAPDAGPTGPEEAKTWLEIYWLPHNAADLAASWDVEAVRRQVEAWALAAGLIGIIQGERHYEAFETCA
jgi:hypothetical protein